MPYGQQAHGRPQVPRTRKKATTHFIDADGNPGVQSGYTKTMCPTKNADIHEEVVYEKREMACGCYCPDVPAHGVCSECAADGGNGLVCKAHHVVCPECGASVCWKHSKVSVESEKRLCLACHRKGENKAAVDKIKSATGRAVRFLLFKPDSNQGDPNP